MLMFKLLWHVAPAEGLRYIKWAANLGCVVVNWLLLIGYVAIVQFEGG